MTADSSKSKQKKHLNYLHNFLIKVKKKNTRATSLIASVNAYTQFSSTVIEPVADGASDIHLIFCCCLIAPSTHVNVDLSEISFSYNIHNHTRQ